MYYGVKLLHTSTAAGATMSSFTPVKIDANIPNSGCTSKIRFSGNTAPGTIVRTIDMLSIWQQITYEWFAGDDEEYIVITGSAWFQIAIKEPSSSAVVRALSVEWEE
jgi:hypothetical protein